MRKLEMSELENCMGGLGRKAWGCGLAVAGTIAVTAGGAFVTSGASLVVFLVSKSIATASIIQACG